MKKNMALTLKWVCYSLSILLLYVLQTAFPLIRIFDIGPVLIVPAAVTIAMYENEKAAAFTGMAVGFLWDFSSGKLAGFNALIIMSCCVVIALLTMYLMQNNILNVMFFTGILLIFQGLLDFFFFYLIWGYGSSYLVLVRDILPTVLYTVAVSPLVYLLFSRIYRLFDGISVYNRLGGFLCANPNFVR